MEVKVNVGIRVGLGMMKISLRILLIWHKYLVFVGPIFNECW